MARFSALSNLNGSARGADALGVFLEKSMLLRFMEQQNAFRQDATSFQTNPVTGASNLQARAIGGAFTATAKTPSSPVSNTLAIYGDAITIDRTHIADANAGLRNVDVWLKTEALKRVRKTAAGLDTAIMTDDGTSNKMKGLKTLLNGTDDIPGFTGVKGVINAKTWLTGNSFDLTPTGAATAANQDAFIEGLYKAILEVPGATGLAMNTTLASRVTAVARRAHILGESRDLFGRPVPTFNGVPIYVVPDTAILNNEPDDTGTPLTVTTSLYIMRPSEEEFALVTNEGLYYKEWDHMESKESAKEEFETRLAWSIDSEDAVRRVRNIKVS